MANIMHTFKGHQTERRPCEVHINPDVAFIPNTLGLFGEVAADPPPSWPTSRLLGLMADFVCIDTAPQSRTAVQGQCCPAGGQPNDKVNESGLDSDMPPSAITGARRTEGEEPMNVRGAENKEEEEEEEERVSEHREEERKLFDLFYKTFQFGPYEIKEGMMGEKRKMEDRKRGHR